MRMFQDIRMRTVMCAVGIWLLAITPAAAQPQPIRTSPIQRCVNLGNMLEAPQEGEWGLVVQRQYLSVIARAGFDTVRIPIRWSAHADAAPPYTIDPAFFARIDEVVGWTLRSGMRAIINVHHYEEMMGDPGQHLPRLRAIWEQIAVHYARHSARLFFEVLNEPNGNLSPAVWNAMLPDLITAIRQTNPRRTIIVGGGEWNSLNGLMQLSLPADNNLIATFHYYEPFRFTHQGAEWVAGMSEVVGVDWGTDAEQAQVKADMQAAADWGTKAGVPVLLGEFGAYSKADMGARVRWTRAVRAAARASRLGWCYWEFAAGFGIYDLASGKFNALYREGLMSR